MAKTAKASIIKKTIDRAADNTVVIAISPGQQQYMEDYIAKKHPGKRLIVKQFEDAWDNPFEETDDGK